MKIGVLALQGSFAEHIAMLRRLGIEAVEVRLPAHLDGLDGLIIPGGESTTIGKLAVHYGLMGPLVAFAYRRAVWGTCAGAIFLSKDAQRDQPLLGLMDIRVARNAFGSQVASFEAPIRVEALGPDEPPFPAVFIRAPLIEAVAGRAQVLACLPPENGGVDGRIVAAREGRWLATSFHPELTADDRFHKYFLRMAAA